MWSIFKASCLLGFFFFFFFFGLLKIFIFIKKGDPSTQGVYRGQQSSTKNTRIKKIKERRE